MRIKEVEYGATVSHNYNNYRVALRVEIDSEKEDVGKVIAALREMVDKELEKDIMRADTWVKDRVNRIRTELQIIEDKIRTIRNSKEFKKLRDVASIIEHMEILKRQIKSVEKELREVVGGIYEENGSD